jgi:hypothetical protein
MPNIVFDPIDATEIENGREAWRRIKIDSTWKDWVLLGKALNLGRRECVRAAQMNRANGSGYNSIFSQWLQENGLSDIDKSARTRLFACLQNLTAIEAWLSTLPLVERLRLKHPSSVWEQFEAAGSATKSAGADEPSGLNTEIPPRHAEIVVEQRREHERESGQDNVSKGLDWTCHIAAAARRLRPTKSKQRGSTF